MKGYKVEKECTFCIYKKCDKTMDNAYRSKYEHANIATNTCMYFIPVVEVEIDQTTIYSVRNNRYTFTI